MLVLADVGQVVISGEVVVPGPVERLRQPALRHEQARSLRRAAHWVGDIAEWSALDVALLGGTASILGALLVGLVDHFYFNIEFPHMAALFWLTVALTMCARRLLSEGIESEPPRAIQSNNKEANKGSADHMLAP